MEFIELENILLEILREAEGNFLLPYQIFEKIEYKNSNLAQRLKDEYFVDAGKPMMGAGAGIPYSPASFIAHALNNLKGSHQEIQKERFEPTDITIKEVQPGNKETISIWAWKE